MLPVAMQFHPLATGSVGGMSLACKFLYLQKTLVGVFASIGGSNSERAGNISAQIVIFDHSENDVNSIIRLENSKVYTSASALNATSPAYLSAFATSVQDVQLYAIFVDVNSGDVHEFRTKSEVEQRRWFSRLQLLILFPFAPIPEEPKFNPIKDVFKEPLEAKQYGASELIFPLVV